MAEFTLHVRLAADGFEPGDGEELLAPYVEAHEGVSYGDERRDDATDADSVVPETASLEIDDLDTFAEIYSDLRVAEGVHELHLWGPEAERFPVPVQHYALQQIQDPDLYVYHALDDKVTLVVAESELEAEQIRRAVPAGALGYRQSPI